MKEQFQNEVDLYQDTKIKIKGNKAVIEPEIVFQIFSTNYRKISLNEDTRKTLNFISNKHFGCQSFVIKDLDEDGDKQFLKVKIKAEDKETIKKSTNFIISLKSFTKNKMKLYIPTFTVEFHE